MDWILDNLSAIFSFVIIVIVAIVWLWGRYRGKDEKVWRDLEGLLRDVLDWLKIWAGDEFNNVTEAEVNEKADWFYDEYVAGSALDRFVSREMFRGLVWTAFTRWRDMFISASHALIK